MRTYTLPVAALLLAGLAARADDWPQWRGPTRTEISNEKGVLKSWPAGGPKLLWTYREGGNAYSGPAVVGKRLYTMTGDNQSEYVLALDTETGKKVWATPIGDFYTNNWGGGPRGTPTVDGKYLYALSARGNLVCLECESGKEVWKVSLTKDFGGSTPNWGYAESPLIDGDWVVCSPGGRRSWMVALNKKDGKAVWQCSDLSDGTGYSSIVIGEVGGVRQYITTNMKAIVGVRAKDGKLLWRHERPGYRTAVIPTPIFFDNHVYATAGYGAGCDLLKLIPDQEGTKYEKVYTNTTMVNQHGGVVLHEGHVYGYSDGGGWTCQDFKSGQSKWTDKKLGKGSLTFVDGMLICYSERGGDVVLVPASTNGWEEKGRFKLPEQSKIRSRSGGIWTHPVVANGKLYLRDQDLIFCYDVRANGAEGQ